MTTKRRHAIRSMVLLSMGMALGKLDVLKASGGELRVPLDEWQSIVFERKGKRLVVSVDEVFKAMAPALQ